MAGVNAIYGFVVVVVLAFMLARGSDVLRRVCPQRNSSLAQSGARLLLS